MQGKSLRALSLQHRLKSTADDLGYGTALAWFSPNRRRYLRDMDWPMLRLETFPENWDTPTLRSARRWVIIGRKGLPKGSCMYTGVARHRIAEHSVC